VDQQTLSLPPALPSHPAAADEIVLLSADVQKRVDDVHRENQTAWEAAQTEFQAGSLTRDEMLLKLEMLQRRVLKQLPREEREYCFLWYKTLEMRNTSRRDEPAPLVLVYHHPTRYDVQKYVETVVAPQRSVYEENTNELDQWHYDQSATQYEEHGAPPPRWVNPNASMTTPTYRRSRHDDDDDDDSERDDQDDEKDEHDEDKGWAVASSSNQLDSMHRVEYNMLAQQLLAYSPTARGVPSGNPFFDYYGRLYDFFAKTGHPYQLENKQFAVVFIYPFVLREAKAPFQANNNNQQRRDDTKYKKAEQITHALEWYLKQRLILLRPSLLVAVGRDAIPAMFHHLAKVRSQGIKDVYCKEALQTTLERGRKVSLLYCPHPFAVLRKEDVRDKFNGHITTTTSTTTVKDNAAFARSEQMWKDAARHDRVQRDAQRDERLDNLEEKQQEKKTTTEAEQFDNSGAIRSYLSFRECVVDFFSKYRGYVTTLDPATGEFVPDVAQTMDRSRAKLEKQLRKDAIKKRNSKKTRDKTKQVEIAKIRDMEAKRKERIVGNMFAFVKDATTDSASKKAWVITRTVLPAPSKKQKTDN
jgi:uracil-DNA glycosylase